MSKLENTDQNIKRAIKIGQNNKKFILDAKKWCSNLVVEDRSGGMVHEIYGLPMMQNIHCRHAAGQYGGMNFEDSARDFIIGHCRGCQHHKEISTPNFGRTVIEEYEAYTSQAEQLKIEKINQKQKLFAEIANAEKTAYPKTSTSQRSLLELIYSLSDEEIDKPAVAEKILEASKIAKPAFNMTVINFIALYFEDEFGGMLLNAVTNVASTDNISDLTKTRTLQAIRNGYHLNDAVGFLSTITAEKEIANLEGLFKQIISTIAYPKSLSHPETKVSYPNIIEFIIRAYEQIPAKILNAINAQLKEAEKYDRNNVNGLIQEITEKSPKLGLLFLEGLLNSFEFDDDSYWDSADYSTCLTICAMFKFDPAGVQNMIQSKMPRMSLGARIEVYQLLGMIALDETVINDHPFYAQGIIQKLVQDLLSKDTKVEEAEKIMDMLSRVSHRSVARIKDHFDSFLGHLVHLEKKLATFLWYRVDLDKPQAQQASFNPYRGMSYFDAHAIETGLTRSIREVESLLQAIINDDQHSRPASILSVILNLDSESNGKLKARLIGLLRKSLNDPLEISRVLPNLYGFLLDYKSIDIRNEGLKLLNHLLDEYRSIVTQPFIELAFVFLDDTQNLIKTRAIESLGILSKVSPEVVGEEQIHKYLMLLINDFKIIHQAAARQVYDVFPLLTPSQRQSVLQSVLILEKIYYDEGEDNQFCEDLIDILLFITRRNEKQFHYIVNDRLLKYAHSKDYYIVKDALKKLTVIRASHPTLSDLWFKEILKFLIETKPDLYSSLDDRADYFEHMHDLPFNVLDSNIILIEDFVKDRIKREIFTDVFNVLGILSYFNLHEKVKSLAEILQSQVTPTKSNEWVMRANAAYLSSATIESHVINKTVNTLLAQ